jgi:membrane protease YdiL (CAAX protease family)
LVLWHPCALGFTWGQTRRHWRWLLVILLINCGVVAGYLWLTSSSTPYSGNPWFVAEVFTVPVVEETMWRGVVLTTLLLLFRRLYASNTAEHLAVWFSGLAFGLLHVGNALAGVPTAFVVVQVLNAAVWGVVYGYVRTRTESLYPPILLHGAMNLVVVLA